MQTDNEARNPAVEIARSRIESEYLKTTKIVKAFPLLSWLSVPSLAALAVIICAGAISYSLFNPENMNRITFIFLIANISIYFLLFILTMWFQLSFMRTNVVRMKQRYSQFKAANEQLKKYSVQGFLGKVQDKIADKKTDESVFPYIFLISLFSQKGRTNLEQCRLIYDLFVSEEEERVSVFLDGSRRFLLWIIRLGIIGTFLGLMTAFVFLGNGLGSIFTEENVKLKEAVSLIMEQSLFGYAAAVLSSLGANVASIVYEFFSIRRLQRFNMTNWMSAVFQWYVLSNETIGDLGDEVNEMVRSIKRVSGSVTGKIGSVNTFLKGTNFYDEFPQLLKSVNDTMHTLDRMTNSGKINKSHDKQ